MKSEPTTKLRPGFERPGYKKPLAKGEGGGVHTVVPQEAGGIDHTETFEVRPEPGVFKQQLQP